MKTVVNSIRAGWWLAGPICLAMITAAPLNAWQSLQDSVSPAAAAGEANDSVSDEALHNLAALVSEFLDKEYMVGAELLVIQRGAVRYHKSFGDVDRKDDRVWENNTICNIRSMTKPITGAAAQILIDRQQLALDDPVAKYLKSFDNDQSRTITVRQVLTHRSGSPLTNLIRVDQFENLAAQVGKAGKTGPQFEPDSKFWYSDIGTDVVGALVAEVSGQPLNEFVQQELLDPLGMTDTFYGTDAGDERFSRIASLYVGNARGWLRFWKPEEKPFYPFAWGSQTIYSTTSDYARFLKMIADEGKIEGRQILSPAAIQRILEPASRLKMMGSDAPYPNQFGNTDVWYGQMMINWRDTGDSPGAVRVIGHSGSDGTAAWAWPDRDLQILYFTQSRGGPTVLKMEAAIDRLLLHPDEEMTASEIPESLRPYVGTYVANFANFENEEFEIFVRDGKLILDIPSQLAFELLDPDDEGKWAFALAPRKIYLKFDRGDDDQVTGLRLHQAGQEFEVPRTDTRRASELSVMREVTPEQMQELTGTYWDDEAGADVRVFVEGETLCVDAPPGIEFHLRPDREKGHWLVRQSPRIQVSFQRDDEGNVVSFTRTIGDNPVVMKRKK